MPTQTQSSANSMCPENPRHADVTYSREHRVADREITLRSIDWDRPAESRPSGTHVRSEEPASLGQLSNSLMTYGIESTKASESGDVLVSAVRRTPANSAKKESNTDASLLTFQVTLRPDQLARLWLREPSLTPSSVLVWSERDGAWVSALKIPEVADHITRARIESVRMWSVLCASRTSASVAPPERRPRFALRPFSAFAQILSNRSRRFPVRNLRLDLEHPATGAAGVAVVPTTTGIAVLAHWYMRLTHWLERLVRYSLHRAKRNASVVSLFAYFSISSIASALVVSRLIELRQHNESALNASGMQRHAIASVSGDNLQRAH